MEAIYGKEGIKASNTGKYPIKLLVEGGQQLIREGAQLIVGGCTEIPPGNKTMRFWSSVIRYNGYFS